ncbi:hypothetical protein [Paenarthrobacter nitroguajacolicus]|uniref:hypothetical protein n=1 Tax=Paenarthrobacter nitroguajacolicus TaxID=211146 RepID=UPI00248ABE12|nr:hypothetical protein [Paenarthrobacter nitroguajacolicus]MDI2036468.1 hypothetical protein [Paenarthrobacter nitroguajacolicus]
MGRDGCELRPKAGCRLSEPPDRIEAGTRSRHEEHIRSFHELVTGSSDITGILKGVTVFAANAMSQPAEARIDCAITLRRRKRTATVAGNSEKAVDLDRIEKSLRQGPRLEAHTTGELTLLMNVATDVHWPKYSQILAAQGLETKNSSKSSTTATAKPAQSSNGCKYA